MRRHPVLNQRIRKIMMARFFNSLRLTKHHVAFLFIFMCIVGIFNLYSKSDVTCMNMSAFYEMINLRNNTSYLKGWFNTQQDYYNYTSSYISSQNRSHAISGIKGKIINLPQIKFPPCMDRNGSAYRRVEDIFCLDPPTFVPSLKNPCYYESPVKNNTRHLKCLPYFYILGVDKSGSTDLHGRMTRHPDIRGNHGSLDKETQFWSWKRYGFFNKQQNLKKFTLDQYTSFFNVTASHLSSHNKSHAITGDATPMDLWDHRGWPMIPQNKNKSEPEVLTPHLLRYIYRDFIPKFLIILREPIERLYSDYVFLRYGGTPQKFHHHALQALKMLEECEANGHSRRWCFYDKNVYSKLPTRLHLSCYSVFLAEWFRVYPREAFFVLRTDEFKNDMAAVMKKLYAFLDVAPASTDLMNRILDQKRRHVTGYKKGVVLPETRAALKGFFDRCNKETAELLQDERFLWSDRKN